MTTEQKIFRAKFGVLELVKPLGNVSKGLLADGLEPGQFPSVQRTQ